MKKNQKNKQSKRKGRPKGSKNKKRKEQTEKKNKNKIIKQEKKITKPIKKQIKIKLNDIYTKNEKFYMVNNITGFISKWEPNTSKEPFSEKTYIILNKFPTEKQYYNIIYGKLKNQ